MNDFTRRKEGILQRIHLMTNRYVEELMDWNRGGCSLDDILERIRVKMDDGKEKRKEEEDAVVREIVSFGEEYGIQSFEGSDFHQQPIHYGIASKSATIVGTLLKYGALPTDRTRNFVTGLLYAALYGSPEIFHLVLEACPQDLRRECFEDLSQAFKVRSVLASLFLGCDDYSPRDEWYMYKTYEEWRMDNMVTLLTLFPSELPLLLQDFSCKECELWDEDPRLVELVHQHARWSSEPRQAWIRAVLRGCISRQQSSIRKSARVQQSRRFRLQSQSRSHSHSHGNDE